MFLESLRRAPPLHRLRAMRERRPRLKNFDYTGKHAYSLTFCTCDRSPIFTTSATVELALSKILQCSAAFQFAVFLYLFMPDHLHLLVRGLAADSDLRACASAMKQRSGYAYAKEHGRRLWQPSYWDHVIRDEEGTAGHITYVLLNPVRAGLVKKPEDYEFWGVPGEDRNALLAQVRRDAPILLVP